MKLTRRGAALIAGAAILTLTGLGSGMATASAATPVATIPSLTGESTSVALDAGFVSALQSLGVAPSPSGTASVKGGVASFPITGGNVTVYKPGEVDPYVQGSIEHQGSGLKLTKGDTVVQLDNFVVDPGKPATLSGRVQAGGQVVAPSTVLFDLDGSTLKPITTDAAAGTATLTGTTVKLSDGAAKALNGAFKTDALKGGITIGIATIVVDLPGHMKQMPAGSVATGGGSTAGMQHTGLLAGGAAAVLIAGAVGFVAIRRRSAVNAGSDTRSDTETR
ncbi:hypothetical protein [Amycolatopsis saalfeldensis]|uniref:LPXTG-motif cell wall anchor domain-containing protein n=1 Tax=Amycolatopsis saalfeldensis TaxID=394193 RepID=A0A1H8U6V2_9PSEU|nr:hypothetical protein [Amycolatopsis saalfeldensis]SEO98806.1 hypothetical protein SAMN04489732_10395 [Amycolatopsis saalfeldensis]